jgi:hypothetical protein
VFQKRQCQRPPVTASAFRTDPERTFPAGVVVCEKTGWRMKPSLDTIGSSYLGVRHSNRRGHAILLLCLWNQR